MGSSVTTTLRALITGDSTSAEAAMGRTATAAAVASTEMESSFDTATSKVGGLFSRVGQAAQNMGIPLAGALTDIGEKFDEASLHGNSLVTALNEVGKVSLVAGAAGLAAVSAESIHLATTFDATVSSIAANAGITVSAAKQIGQAFLDTAGTTIYSGQEIASAYASVAAQLGAIQGHALSTGQAMTVMKASMDLAEASGESLDSSTSALANVMQAYGIKASGAAKASDELFQAGRLSGNGMSAVASAIQRLHTQLGATTPSLGQTGALLVDMANHGENGSRAIRTLATAMTTLLKPASAVIQAQSNLTTIIGNLPPAIRSLGQAYANGTINSTQFSAAEKNLSESQRALLTQVTSGVSALDLANTKYQELGIQVVNAKGQFVGIKSVIEQLGPALQGMTQQQQLAALTQVFGASAAQKLLTTVAAGPAAFDKAAAAVEKTNAAHEAAEKQSQTLQHQLETLKATAEDYGVKLGDALIPKIESVIKSTAQVVEWFAEHKTAAEALAGVIGGVLATSIAVYAVNLGTRMVESTKNAITSVGNLVTSLRGQQEVTTTAAAALQEQNAEMVESSIYFKQAAAAAKLEAQYQSQLTEVERVQAEAAQTLSGVNLELGESYDVLTEAQQVLVDGFAELEVSEDAFAATSVETGAAASLALGPIGIAVMAVVAIGTLLVTHWQQVKSALLVAWHAIDNAARAVWGAIEDFFKAWWPEILGVFTGGVGLLPALIVQHWHTIEDDAKSIWGDIENFFKSWWPEIVGVFTAGIGLLPALLVQHWQQISTDAHNWWDNVLTFIESIPSKILAVFVGAGQWLDQIGHDILHGLWQGIQDEWTGLGDIGSTVKGWITGAIGDATQWLLQAGKDILSGLWNGIKSGENDLLGKIKGVGSDIVGAFKSALSIFSPSQVMALQVGVPIAQGVAQGILTGQPTITNAAQQAANAATRVTPPIGIGSIAAAAGGTSNPTLISGVNSALLAGGTPQQSVASLPPMPLTVELHMDNQQVAQILLPDIRTAFLQQKRAVVTLGLS